ncbi:MAG: hypothetical protein SOY80_06400 [Bacilli bacterium]|nr:hypothetical protein [Bacilli bacterium]MDY4543883.1 hypothetical protein [Bacilli bacterium]
MKKILMICFVLVIVSVMVGCSKTNNSLKKRKCAQLDKIYEELDYKEYSLSNWNLIINCIEECKSKIMLCNEKNQINKIYNETITKIHEINKKPDKFNVLDFKEVVYNGYAVFGEYKKIHIIDNYNELIALFSNISIFGVDNKNFVIENYTSDFFRDKIILVYFYYGQSSNIKRYINEISKCNNNIKVQMNAEQYGNSLNDDIFVIPFIIEFNKNDISLECDIELYEKYIVFKK